MEEKLKNRIVELINSSRVFLFMKGTSEQPQCGFSARVVAVLKNLEIEFKFFDVYSDEEIRQGIKEYADWPTIPQLYINGKFIGGCDIVVELAEEGELKKMVNFI
ncbi:MAG TPA: Grx4 family monothiol glutaredoxin [Candidatus Nanoarchaeia archaeon]|nr:Grx4 family monothiol glutaredoxin [Candidatus Nanoarchaeia archaeon]